MVTYTRPPLSFQLTSGAVNRRINGCVNVVRAKASKSERKKGTVSAAKKKRMRSNEWEKSAVTPPG